MTTTMPDGPVRRRPPAVGARAVGAGRRPVRSRIDDRVRSLRAPARRPPRRHAVPAADHRRRRHVRGRRTPVPQGRARGAHPAHPQAMRDIAHLLRPGHLAQLRRHPRRPRGLGQRPLRRPRAAEERRHRRRRRAARLPGHRHRHRHGQEGPAGPHRRRRRGGHRPGRVRHVHDGEPALLADGAAHHVGGGQHRHQPAGPDRDLRHRRRRVRLPVHGQGRRLGQQELPVPGDEGAAQPDEPHGLPRRQAAHARHGGVPAVPPGHRHRRHVGGAHAEDGQAGVGALPRRPADERQRARQRLPRPRARGRGARADPPVRHRRPVRRQVLLPRRARHPPAPPRRLVPGRDRGVVLGRPPGPRQDHRRRRLPRAARARPGPVPARDDRRRPRRRRREHRPQPAHGRDPGRAQPPSGARRGCR